MFAKVLGAVLVLVTLAACAPTPAGPTTPVVPAVPAVPAEQLALPFDRYRPGFADESEVQRARTALVRDCLRDLGVRLDVPDDVRVPGVLDLSPNLRRYGVVDDPTATDFGYHFPRTAAESKRQQEQQRWSAGLTQAQRETLFGEHGCTGRADRELGPVDDGFLIEADFQSLRTSGADPRVAAVTALWRTCMDGLGFDYADPTAAISDPRWDLD
jgi:hypothetical protein